MHSNHKPTSMSESKVWSHFRLAWPYHCDRQEPGIGAGQPDVPLLDKRGNRGLVELKRPSKVELRTSQWTWHEIDQRNKGRSCVVTCDNIKGRIWWQIYDIDVAAKQLELAHGENWIEKDRMVQYVAEYLRLAI